MKQNWLKYESGEPKDRMLVDMFIFATENPPQIFPFFSYKSVKSERTREFICEIQ